MQSRPMNLSIHWLYQNICKKKLLVSKMKCLCVMLVTVGGFIL